MLSRIRVKTSYNLAYQSYTMNIKTYTLNVHQNYIHLNFRYILSLVQNMSFPVHLHDSLWSVNY